MKVTKEDINRNFKLLNDDKPLDMPLSLLDGKLKKKVRDNSDEYKKYHEKYHEKYYEKNRDKINIRRRELYKQKHMSQKKEDEKIL